jgi:hypothetical protein
MCFTGEPNVVDRAPCAPHLRLYLYILYNSHQNLTILLQQPFQHPPRILRLLHHIQIPQPPEPLLPRLPQLLPVVPDPRETQAQQLRVLLAALDDVLGARPAHRVVGLERGDDIPLCRDDGRVGEELGKDVRVFDGLACSSALVGGRGVGGVAEDGDAGAAERGDRGLLEDGPLGWVGHVLC